jgi:hypothetical protein
LCEQFYQLDGFSQADVALEKTMIARETMIARLEKP